MDEILIDLELAYRNIHPKYYNKNVIHSLDGDATTTQDIERVVLAELYHQWRIIMTANNDRYQHLILHSEIGKRMENNQGVKHPDLVLHGGQIGPLRLTHNKVFVELKMSSFDVDDIFKCFHALHLHNYMFSVCIIHEITLQEIINSISRYPDLFRGNEDYFDRLYFLSRNFDIRNLTTIQNIN